MGASGDRQQVRLGESVVDFRTGVAMDGGQTITLETKELDVLELLVENAGTLVTYKMFCERVWEGAEHGLEANVHTRASALRVKLGIKIQNRRNQGYILTTPVEWIPERVPAVGTDAPPSPAPADSPPPRVEPSVEAVLSVLSPSNGQATPEFDQHSHWSRILLRSRALVIVALALALVGIGATTGLYWFNNHKGQPSGFTIEGRLLSVMDERNRFLWNFTFPNIVSEARVTAKDWPHKFIRFTKKADTGLVVSGGRELYCFDRWGNQMWVHPTGREVLAKSGGRVPDNYTIRLLDALTRPRADGGRIIIGASRGPGALFVLELLTKDGQKVGEYFHFGWFFDIKVAALTNGHEDIFLTGVDPTGRDHEATLVVLNPDNFSGQSTTQASDGAGALQDVPTAHEKAILLVKKFGPPPRPGDFSTGRYVTTSGAFLELYINEGAPGAWYRFDNKLQLQIITPELVLQQQLQSTILKNVPGENWQAVLRSALGDIVYVRNDFADSK